MWEAVNISTMVFCAAFVVAATLCPGVIWMARAVGFIDRPNESHKQQGFGVALGGGIAIFLAVATVSAFALIMGPSLWGLDRSQSTSQLTALLLASLLILLAGFVDDRYGMKGFHKLGWQTLAAMVLVAGGYQFRAFVFSGFRFDFGHLGIILSVLWILGAVNALNLIDGADGVAATLGVGICISLGIAAALVNGQEASVVSFSLAGALAGFLVYNFPPAKIYLGDSGSMLVGLVAAAAAIESSVKVQATFAFAAPLLLLSVPIIDTGLAIFRRKLMGRSIYDTDCGHLHHCLLDRGWSPRQVVGIVALLSVFTSVTAIATVYAGFDVLSMLAVCLLLGIGIRWKVMGRGEIDLITSRLGARWRRRTSSTNDVTFVHIQGERDWRSAWAMILEFVRCNQIDSAEISTSLPWIREAFSGRVGDVQVLRSRACWRLSIPLKVDGTNSGWIEFAGTDRVKGCDEVTLFEFAARLEVELGRLAKVGSQKPAERPVLAPTFANITPTVHDGVTLP